jgi:branched-chain amino acid transport system substrate-binding protein
MKRNSLWTIIALGVGTLLFLTLPSGVLANDEIKIGLITPLSAPGDYKSGEINVKTAELAVDELNAKGGILGKKVALVKADDEGKPAVGVVAMKRMIASQKVSAIVGLWHSSVAVAQAKVASSMHVPIMLHYSWTDTLTESHSDYVYRVGPFNSEIARLLLPYLTKSGFKTVAAMYETTAFGTGFANALAKYAEAKGLKVYKVAYPAEATDLKPQLLDLKGKNPKPDILIVAAVYQATNLIPKQAFEIGLAPQCSILASWDWPTYPDFWEIMGKKGVGMTYATFESAKLKLSPLGEHFKNAFKTKYGYTPPVFAYFLYDECMILANTMERIKSSDPEKIAKALKDTKFEGTTGLITFERKKGAIWNQWMGHQLFVKKMTAYKQSGDQAEVIYP